MDYLKVRDVKNEETSDYQINGIQEFIPRTEEAVAEIAGIRLLVYQISQHLNNTVLPAPVFLDYILI